MAPKIVEDLIAGAGISEDGDGFKKTRVFQVSDLTGFNAQAVDAAAMLLNGIPQINGLHPEIPFIRVRTRTCIPLNKENTQFKITVNYARLNQNEGAAESDSPAQISVGTNISSFQTDLDKNDVQMVLKPKDGAGNAVVKALPDQTYVATITRATSYFTYVRREDQDPSAKSKTFTNTINSVIFNGDAIGTVFCNGIRGVSDDGGQTYTVTYSFQTDPLGWDSRAVYNQPNSDKPLPAPSIADKTEAIFEHFDLKDFNSLNLT